MNPRLCCTYFPAVDGCFVHPELLGDLSLEQPKVESPLAKVVANCSWFFRIGGVKLDEIEAQFEGVEGLRKVVIL